MGSRNQLKATRTRGFESRLLSHQALIDLSGKAVPLQAVSSSTKAAVFHPRTATAADVQRLGDAEASLLCSSCLSRQLFCPAALAAALGHKGLSLSRFLVPSILAFRLIFYTRK